MKKDNKYCCRDCKKGKPGKNHTCQARIMIEKLKEQQEATKNSIL